MRELAFWMFGGLVATSLIGWAGEGAVASASPATQSTQQVAGGGVTVSATLSKDGGSGPVITLAFNTHSVNLDGYDIRQIAVLRDDTGKSYPVEAVEQASGGGHHRQAVLRFGKLAADAKRLELIVKDVAGVKERTFRWDLTQ